MYIELSFILWIALFLEKFTPLVKILHCRRKWRHWQISPLPGSSRHFSYHPAPFRSSDHFADCPAVLHNTHVTFLKIDQMNEETRHDQEEDKKIDKARDGNRGDIEQPFLPCSLTSWRKLFLGLTIQTYSPGKSQQFYSNCPHTSPLCWNRSLS